MPGKGRGPGEATPGNRYHVDSAGVRALNLATTITVAIPTHNRASTLGQTLSSIAALTIPANAQIECLVVDNGSTDATPEVVAAAAMPFAIRRVFEERLGSSFARNRAIDESRADFIFFIDDDATAEPSWAAELLAALEHRQLDAVCGMVLPRWSVAPPEWLGPSLWVKLAVHIRERIEAEPIEKAEVLANYFSANVGFRRSAFDRFGKFREDLGVVGGNPISGEDTELFERIVVRGGAMGFAPCAIVHHLIPPERMTRAYLRRKSFAYGLGSAVAGGRSHNGIDKLVKNLVRMSAAALSGNSEGTIYHQLECANFLGYWRGRLGRRK
jgi:glycosyltransferase involved in cell wall biosynthesis